MKNSILVKFLGLIVSLTAPAIIALLPVFVGFRDGLTVTDLNDFNGLAQTTNLGDGRSHHSRRAADLAKVAGLSRMHFAAQFRAATGYRPCEYLLHQRIEHAKSLLSNTETPLAEVALTVGFCTQAHFSTVFKRITSETLASWRCAQCRPRALRASG